ncbi:hypothetical protein ES703_79656 [subsurface metagenome]
MAAPMIELKAVLDRISAADLRLVEEFLEFLERSMVDDPDLVIDQYMS